MYSDMEIASTVVAIAGEDFAVIGSDVRLTRGYSILSRNESKMTKMYFFPQLSRLH